MSSDPGLRTRRYRFDLEVEVTAALDLSGGEMSELISEGLIKLDHRGLLFPGLLAPPPGEHLSEISLEYTGTTQSPTAPIASERATGQVRRPPRSVGLADELQAKALELGDALLQLRMLQARMRALSAELSTGRSDRAHATGQAALAAADAVIEQAESVTPHVLGEG